MARTRSIHNATILEAARAIFVEKGYSATTAEIARAAGISEGTLFRRFDSKVGLFKASMGIADAPPWFALIDERVGRGDVRDNLLAVANGMLNFFREMVPKMTSLMCSPLDPLEVLRQDPDPMPLRGLRKLSAFFEDEVALGRLRPCDGSALAHLTAGAIHLLVFAERAGFAERFAPDTAAHLQALVDTLLSGLLPETA